MRDKIRVFMAMLFTLVALGAFAGTVEDPPAQDEAAKKAAEAKKQAEAAATKKEKQQTIQNLEKVLEKAVMEDADVATWVRCDVGTEKKCNENDKLYVNASQSSILELVNVPKDTCLYVMSGERSGDSPRACFKHSDRVFVAVHRKRKFRSSYRCKNCSSGQNLNWALNSDLTAVSRLRAKKDKDTTVTADDYADDVPLIEYVTEGNSSRLVVHAVTKDPSNDPQKDVTNIVDIPLAYQPWFVDSGGFLAFTTLVDKEITKRTQPDGTVKVENVRWSNRLTPNTGVAINFHPANYPAMGVQFALTTVEEKVTYHLGGAYRLRSIGSKAIATVAAGLAVGQVNRFPDIKTGDLRLSTDAGLNPTKRWATGGYLSLSFGFTFGNGSGTTTETQKPTVTQSTP